MTLLLGWRTTVEPILVGVTGTQAAPVDVAPRGYARCMAVAATDMSAADYLATPESWPEHTELIDGTVVVGEP